MWIVVVIEKRNIGNMPSQRTASYSVGKKRWRGSWIKQVVQDRQDGRREIIRQGKAIFPWGELAGTRRLLMRSLSVSNCRQKLIGISPLVAQLRCYYFRSS